MDSQFSDGIVQESQTMGPQTQIVPVVTSNNNSSNQDNEFRPSSDKNCTDAFEYVILTLTIPLWTFVTIYLLLALIKYLRKIQYFKLYDRCTQKNAHFRYEFHVIIGKHTPNYNMFDSHIIIDLLDNQLVSTMTVQVPGSTIFNDNQAFLYNHSRPNLRCTAFTIFRKHPIKDVRCIRVAHSCSNQDSRLFIYGVNLYDVTNSENKFFPITSVVKYRGTHWALNTTFEPKVDGNFSKLGCNCYDPFGVSNWPTYPEILVFIFHLWASVFYFGHLITTDSIMNSLALHVLTIIFITGTSATVVAVVYLRFIKCHIVDQHYETSGWSFLAHVIVGFFLGLSIGFWSSAMRQTEACRDSSLSWITSSVISASTLTLIVLIIHFFTRRRKISIDNAILEESDSNLMKTNSRPNIEFAREDNSGFFQRNQQFPQLQQVPRKNMQTGNSANIAKVSTSKRTSSKRRSDRTREKKDETMEGAFESDSKYIKTKNRNSISQYV